MRAGRRVALWAGWMVDLMVPTMADQLVGQLAAQMVDLMDILLAEHLVLCSADWTAVMRGEGMAAMLAELSELLSVEWKADQLAAVKAD